MNKYIFTFGCGQVNAGKCQPIYAESWGKAREIMFDLYGDKWAFQYDEKAWEEWKAKANAMGFPCEMELPAIGKPESEVVK